MPPTRSIPRPFAAALRQRGLSLLESLIAILVFCIGALALVGMFARAVGTARDSQFRTEAAVYANEILNAIAAAVDRDPVSGDVLGAGTANSLDKFGFAARGLSCAFAPDTVPPHPVTDLWRGKIRASTGLPWTGSGEPLQIRVDSADHNRVSVTICWMVPGETVANHHVVSGHVN